MSLYLSSMYCIAKSASTPRNAPASPKTLKHPHSNRCEHNNYQATRFGNSVSGIGVHSNRPELKESLRETFGVLSYEACTVQRTATSTVARFPTGATGSAFISDERNGIRTILHRNRC